MIFLGFYCISFNLDRAYRQGFDLTKKDKTFGAIFSTVFALLTLLLVSGTVTIIISYFKTGPGFTIPNIFSHFIFLSLTITSVYLSIHYWKIRKATKSQFINVVEEIGNDAGS